MTYSANKLPILQSPKEAKKESGLYNIYRVKRTGECERVKEGVDVLRCVMHLIDYDAGKLGKGNYFYSLDALGGFIGNYRSKEKQYEGYNDELHICRVEEEPYKPNHSHPIQEGQ